MADKLKYVPLTQQKYCCVPTCVQMILLRRGIPLLPQEEIGKFLGLVIPEEKKYLFSDLVVTGEKPKTGYGTQINEKKYSLNSFFSSKKIPLQAREVKTGEMDAARALIEKSIRNGNDIIALHHHKGIDETGKDCGHACLIFKISGNRVGFVDPSPETKKEYSVDLVKLLDAMSDKFDGNQRAFWIISKKE